jgi:hypothetical protein
MCEHLDDVVDFLFHLVFFVCVCVAFSSGADCQARTTGKIPVSIYTANQ